mmetsp:Transcript_17203/g.32574  ORF Transcript_17203/g.32574 Transcript_17203/m.32574 type:complete len:279 (+) Transcript_17203:3007-3843(+)
MNFLDIPKCMVTGELVDKREDVAYRLVELEDDHGHLSIYKIPLVCVNTRLYTSDRLIPSHESVDAIKYDMHGPIIQKIISDEPTRILWHTRFGHLNFRCLSSLHQSVVGLPVIKDAHRTDNCPSCLESKLRRSATGHRSLIDKATSYGQVLAADWGLICLKSDDDECVDRLRSVFGETGYLVFTCAYSGALFGACGPSKSVPVEWLDIFLYRISHHLHRISHNLHHLNKSVLVDRGSELGHSLEFSHYVHRYKYKLLTCGPDKSSIIGLCERDIDALR